MLPNLQILGKKHTVGWPFHVTALRLGRRTFTTLKRMAEGSPRSSLKLIYDLYPDTGAQMIGDGYFVNHCERTLT